MGLLAEFTREQDDVIAQEDAEREKLLKHLSIDFFLEALTEAENATLSQLVDAFKTGDSLRLGNLVRDRVNEYVEETINYDPTPWCHQCRARTLDRCKCGPIADNN